MREIAKGSFLALFGAICWGVSGCVAQYLFEYEGMDSNWLTPLRLGLAGVVLFLYYLLRSKKDRQALFAPWRDPRDAIDLVIYGLVGVSGCQFLYFLTIQLSTAGVATILQNLSPVMVLGVTCLQARRAPRAFEIVSIVLALVGLFLLTTHGSLTGLVISPAALVSGLLSGVCVVHNVAAPAAKPAFNPGYAVLGVCDGRGGVRPCLCTVGQRVCTLAARGSWHCVCLADRQRVGLLLLYAGGKDGRRPAGKPVHLRRAGYRRAAEHTAFGFPFHMDRRSRVCLHLRHADPAEPAAAQACRAGRRSCKIKLNNF